MRDLENISRKKRMSHLVLKDSRIIELTPEQSQKLSLVILMSTSDREIKLGTERFRINDILTGREEIQKVLQRKLIEVEPIVIHKKGKGRQELS